MTRIYRAMWSEDGELITARARLVVAEWLAGTHPGLELPELGRRAIESDRTRVSVDVASACANGVSAASFAHTVELGDERLDTTVSVLVDERGSRPDQWVWVDVDRVADDSFEQPRFAAPAVARALLDDGIRWGGEPRLGQIRFATAPTAIDEDRVRMLAGLVRDPRRSVPLVVVSHDPFEGPAVTVERATAAAEILAGVAIVFFLVPSAIDAFSAELGEALGVWGGAARLYLPGDLEPSRHRYVRREAITLDRSGFGHRFLNLLSLGLGARRLPAAFELVRSELRRSSEHSLEQLLDIAETVIDELREQLDGTQSRLEAVLLDHEELHAELVDQRRLNTVLAGKLARGQGRDAKPTAPQVPERVASLTEAAALCRELLGGVAIPEAACQDLDRCDAAVESGAWAQTAWQGLRALSAYAADSAHYAGFWNWCEKSENPLAWRATDKKLAMRESRTVMGNDRLRSFRLMPVDVAVDPSGRILMEAHLKIATGGGDLAPRIYFHDDTNGVTGKVHVGFFGPHRHVPNTRRS